MKHRILVVEDEEKLRRVIELQLSSSGYEVDKAGTAEEALQLAGRADLVLTDLRLPGMDGLELLTLLRRQDSRIPVVVMTAFGTVENAVQAMKAGAIDFLTKPVTGATLVAAVRAGLEQDALARQATDEGAMLRQRYASLSVREREVLAGLAAGKLNKQIAAALGITEATVKFHRARLMDRMQAQTVAELMHLAARLDGLR